MNILLTGASGQLGHELLPLLAQFGQVTTVDQFVDSAISRECIKLDLSDLNRVEILLNRLRPDLVVNAAAYTAVDRAESHNLVGPQAARWLFRFELCFRSRCQRCWLAFPWPNL